MKLSRDAEVIAVCYYGLGMQMKLKFMRPHIIHPRMRAALDELTGAKLLTRDDDPRGPMEWKPNPKVFSVARKFKRPVEGESFPMTSE